MRCVLVWPTELRCARLVSIGVSALVCCWGVPLTGFSCCSLGQLSCLCWLWGASCTGLHAVAANADQATWSCLTAHKGMWQQHTAHAAVECVVCCVQGQSRARRARVCRVLRRAPPCQSSQGVGQNTCAVASVFAVACTAVRAAGRVVSSEAQRAVQPAVVVGVWRGQCAALARGACA